MTEENYYMGMDTIDTDRTLIMVLKQDKDGMLIVVDAEIVSPPDEGEIKIRIEELQKKYNIDEVFET